jgi:hypothetical protein
MSQSGDTISAVAESIQQRWQPPTQFEVAPPSKWLTWSVRAFWIFVIAVACFWVQPLASAGTIILIGLLVLLWQIWEIKKELRQTRLLLMRMQVSHDGRTP